MKDLVFCEPYGVTLNKNAMKTLLMTLIVGFAGFTMSAQVDRVESSRVQDRLDQQPPVPAQTAVNRAARQADINEQNNRNIIDSENLLEDQIERATGKETKNPAETPPSTVHPPRLTDPVSAPVNAGNRISK